MPPGTGDVQLAVLQDIQLTGAVAVTTPSKLAAVDTQKGIEMFTSLGVPTLAVVENMSYFEVDNVRHYPLGQGMAKHELVESESVPLIQMAISPVTNNANDDGVPFCLSRPSEAEQELNAMRQLCDVVTGEILRGEFGQQVGGSNVKEIVVFPDTNENDLFDLNSLSLDLTNHSSMFTIRLFSDNSAVQRTVVPAALRSRDPKTGEEISSSPFLAEARENPPSTGSIDPMVQKTGGTKKQSPSLVPSKVQRRGRYGFSVVWGDGSTIIYSTKSIARAAGGMVQSTLSS